MKWTALCLVALLLYGSFCNAQRFQEVLGQPPHGHEQGKQIFERPLKWTYPPDPTYLPAVVVSPTEDVMKHPASATTVAVHCGENTVQVIAKKDLFGIGYFINPAHLTLGNCGFVAEDRDSDGSPVIIFESELHGCDSSLSMTEDSLIYTYDLKFDPEGTILRINKAAITVECHYQRVHNVSTLPLIPYWVPFSATKMSEELLFFTLRLMTDDWLHQRATYVYFLGMMIKVEVSVIQYFHVPLRIFIDSCVVSTTADPSSSPNYAVIQNGCLVDSLNMPASRFIHRVEDNKLRFEVPSLMFKNYENNLLYITCHLKAAPVTYGIDTEHRACFYDNGWHEASGVNDACSTCHSTMTDSSSWNLGGGTNTGSVSGSAGSGHIGISVSGGGGHHSGYHIGSGSLPGSGGGAHHSGYHTGSGALSGSSGGTHQSGYHTVSGSHSGSRGGAYQPMQPTGTGSHSASGGGAHQPMQPTGTGSHSVSGGGAYQPMQPTGTGSHSVSGGGAYQPMQPTGTGSHSASGGGAYQPMQPTGTGSHSASRGGVYHPKLPTGTGSHSGSSGGAHQPMQPTGTGSHSGSGGGAHQPMRPTGTGSHSGSGGGAHQPMRPTGTGSHSGSGGGGYQPKQPTGTGSRSGSGGGAHQPMQPTGTGSHSGSGGGGYQPMQPTGTGSHSGSGGGGYQPKQPTGTGSRSGSGGGAHQPVQPSFVSGAGSVAYSPNQPSGAGVQPGSVSVSYHHGHHPGAGSYTGPGTAVHSPDTPSGPVAHSGSVSVSYHHGQPPSAGSYSSPATVDHNHDTTIGVVTPPGSVSVSYHRGSHTNNPDQLSGTDGSRSGSSTVSFFSRKLPGSNQNPSTQQGGTPHNNYLSGANLGMNLIRARRDVSEGQNTVMEWESHVTLEIRVNRNTDD